MGVLMVSKSICSLLVRLTQRDMLTVYTNLAWGGGAVAQSWQQTSFLCDVGSGVHSCKCQKRNTEMKFFAVCHVTLVMPKTVPKNGLCPWAGLQLFFFFLYFFRWVCIFPRRTRCCFPVASCSILRYNQKESRNRINGSSLDGWWE